jgi:26S proteasome regulatory subunit N10
MNMGSSGMSASMGASGNSMAGGAAAGGGDNFDMYGGIDPSMDPELAMAIRASTEEARAKEEARVKTAQDLVIALFI